MNAMKAALYEAKLKERGRYPLETISRVNSMIKGTSIPNQKLYVNLGNELTKNGDLKTGLLEFDTKVAKAVIPIYIQKVAVQQCVLDSL